MLPLTGARLCVREDTDSPSRVFIRRHSRFQNCRHPPVCQVFIIRGSVNYRNHDAAQVGLGRKAKRFSYAGCYFSVERAKK